MEETKTNETDQPVPESATCDDCGLSFKTAQGLAGHGRLAHSTSTARALDDRNRELEEHGRAVEARAAEIARRETVAKRREAEIARRKQEIDSTGPKSLGLSQCNDCGAWFDDGDGLRAHSRSAHPLDEKVAAEVGVGKGRVNDVWTEAAYKQQRHPNETPEQIVKRFWGGTDQKVLRALLARNASFQFATEE